MTGEDTGRVDIGRVDTGRGRLQRITATLLVAVVPWLVAPGMLQPDTKTALVLSPARYLERALWAWSDHTGIGELQNQAYGYLWPMGPVFLAGDAAGVPDWAVQRIWWMLILVISFLGAERVARRLLGAATIPALVAGAAFALSPRVLTVLAEISVEVWPQALAPWLLLAAASAVAPGAGGRERRRAAVATGLLTACLGGVNATVSLVALVPAAAWILLAPAGRARWRALAWWCGGALLGALWWLGPLVVLGRYAYPFLDHIELASTTTAVASVVNVLRGANHWIAYILTPGEHPTWQSGWVLAQSVPAILATSTLAGLGLAGVLGRRAQRQPPGQEEARGGRAPDPGPHLTRWALTLVLLGVVAMAIGRSGAASGPFAEAVQGLLDGPLAPFRNVHKADLLVRLPVALGVGMLAHWATRVAHGAGPVARHLVVTTLVLALVGTLAPLWAGRVGDAWATRGVPESWHEMAERVDGVAARDGGTTLVLPGAQSADFTWGRVTDEPLTALASSPVLVRAAAPLGHPGTTRILDHLDELTSTGRSQPWLAEGLRRLGVSRVVVRGGLQPDVRAVDPVRVADTLEASPGLSREWAAGEGSEQISLWRVDEPAVPATMVPRDGAVPVAASPEGWFPMVAAGVLDPDAVTTPAAGPGAQVRSDTLRWQARNSGRPPARGRGPTLPASDPRPSLIGTRDLAPGGRQAGRTTRTYRGLTGVEVSSSGADPFAPQWRSAQAGPASLVDGDGRTAWVSGDGEAVQRVTLSLAESARPSAVLVHEAWGGDVERLRSVSVDGSDGKRIEGTTTWRVPLDASARDEIVLELRGGDASTSADAIGVREVELTGGPDLGTALRTPAGPGAAVLTRDPRGGDDLDEGEDPDDLVRRPGPMPTSRVETGVRIRPGDAAQDLLVAPWSLQGSTPPEATGSSRGMGDWPVAAVDGDPATRWAPASGESEPVLDIDFGSRQRVERITLDRAAGSVTVATDENRYVVPGGTTITIPAQETRRLSLTFTRPEGRAAWTAPEVTVPGVDGPGERIELDCGDAGSVARAEGSVGLGLDADLGSLLAGEVTTATDCGELPAGDGAVTADTVEGLVPEAVTLRPAGWEPTAVEARDMTGRREHAGRWTFDVDTGEESLLVLHQGANDGWRATGPDGERLDKVTVDGWRQAFVVPEGASGRVLVDFAPNRLHRLALALGAAGAALLLVWGALELLVRRRRRRADDAHENVPDTADAAAGDSDGPPAPPTTGAGVSRVLAALAAGVVGILVAGWVGLLAAAAGALVPVRGRGLVVVLVLTGAGVALTVLGVADRQSAGAWVSQGLGALTLGVLVAALLRPGRGGPARAPDAPPASTTDGPDRR